MRNLYLSFILASTRFKCAISPPNGLPGVPSTMYPAYSGRQRVGVFLNKINNNETNTYISNRNKTIWWLNSLANINK